MTAGAAAALTSAATRARAARRIVLAAGYSGGGLGLLTGAVLAVLVAEAKLARRWIGEPESDPPVSDGVYGHFPGGHPHLGHHHGEPISFAMLGDSSAAGLGVHDPHETPGALLAAGLSAAAGRPVRLTNVAKTGAQSSDLDRQVALALRELPAARGDHDRRQRRHPPGTPVAVGAVPDRRRHAGCTRRAARWWSAPARISAPSSRSRSRCAGSPGGGAASSPRRRRSPWSRPAVAPCPSATCSARSSPRGRRRCSALTGSTRPRPATQTAAEAMLPSLTAALGLGPEEAPSAYRGRGRTAGGPGRGGGGGGRRYRGRRHRRWRAGTADRAAAGRCCGIAGAGRCQRSRRRPRPRGPATGPATRARGPTAGPRRPSGPADGHGWPGPIVTVE